MVFSSPLFLFGFLPLVLLAHFLVPRSARNFLLLAAGLVFYAWGEPWFSLVLVTSIGVNYLLGLLVDRCDQTQRARVVVGIAVVLNIGLLAVFKYAHFIVDNVNLVLVAAGQSPIRLVTIELPIGISFFTFQALSYVVDVYRGQVPAQRKLLLVALYISLFPQLIAGPIVRYGDVAGHLGRRIVTRAGFAEGVRRFVVGLGKKVLIANSLAGPADAIFAIPGSELTVSVAWFGLVCYTLQLYFDFSGYSDMAIGLGRMVGFTFLENFNYPYISRSVSEFWRRWHISLSSWFRDYVFVPLGSNRGGVWRTYLNLWLVFLLCGLWHGASWNFAVWGLFHGSFLVVERAGLSTWLFRWRSFSHLYLLAVVMVGWVLFRTPTMGAAVTFLAAMAGRGTGTGIEHHLGLYLDAERAVVIIAGAIGSCPLWRVVWGWCETARSPVVRVALDVGLVVLVMSILLASASMLAAGTHNPFIYFRF